MGSGIHTGVFVAVAVGVAVGAGVAVGLGVAMGATVAVTAHAGSGAGVPVVKACAVATSAWIWAVPAFAGDGVLVITSGFGVAVAVIMLGGVAVGVPYFSASAVACTARVAAASTSLGWGRAVTTIGVRLGPGVPDASGAPGPSVASGCTVDAGGAAASTVGFAASVAPVVAVAVEAFASAEAGVAGPRKSPDIWRLQLITSTPTSRITTATATTDATGRLFRRDSVFNVALLSLGNTSDIMEADLLSPECLECSPPQFLGSDGQLVGYRSKRQGHPLTSSNLYAASLHFHSNPFLAACQAVADRWECIPIG